MAAKDVAKAWQKLSYAQQAESMLGHAYAMAGKTGLPDEIRDQFRALAESLNEHRSALQEAASETLKGDN